MRPIAVPDFKVWMEALMDTLNAPQVHLLTYSMGGRIALKTAELLPHRVAKNETDCARWFSSTLDIQSTVWHCTRPLVCQTTIDHPGWIFGLTRLLAQLRLLHPKTEKFVEVHFGTREKRILLQTCGHATRTITQTIHERIAHLINHQDLDIQLVFGTRDSVIPVKLGTRFQKRLNRPVLHTIDNGHQLLTPELLHLFEREQLWF